VRIIPGIFLLFVLASADAALIDRGGGLIYDDVLDITWLQDANYPLTSGYGDAGVDGIMTWDEADNWAIGLEYGGFTEWRLPSMDVNADTTIVDCSSVAELACRDNELGYMFHQYGVTAATPDPFINLVADYYWSGTEYAQFTQQAWLFNPVTGTQNKVFKSDEDNAWAVHEGDIGAIPIPAAAWLFASALAGLMGLRRRAR